MGTETRIFSIHWLYQDQHAITMHVARSRNTQSGPKRLESIAVVFVLFEKSFFAWVAHIQNVLGI